MGSRSHSRHQREPLQLVPGHRSDYIPVEINSDGSNIIREAADDEDAVAYDIIPIEEDIGRSATLGGATPRTFLYPTYIQ